MDLGLAGKTVVVTGATANIGRAIALEMAGEASISSPAAATTRPASGWCARRRRAVCRQCALYRRRSARQGLRRAHH